MPTLPVQSLAFFAAVATDATMPVVTFMVTIATVIVTAVIYIHIQQHRMPSSALEALAQNSLQKDKGESIWRCSMICRGADH